MSTTTVRLTYDDLERIPQERPGDRHELIGGVLYVTASPIPLHQIASGNFMFALERVVRSKRLGWVFSAPVDVYFTPEDNVVPDVCFVRRDRLSIIGEKKIEGVPDLIAEVLSPSTRSRDRGLKKALYARFGVREYWLLDPVPRTVTVWFHENGNSVELPITDGIARSRVVPGFAVAVADLFVLD
jgi:Uma2 family endonuclease